MLYAASELQIFDYVADHKGICTAENLSKTHKWTEDYTERLLNTLVSLKFMEKSKGKSGKGEYVRSFLKSSSKTTYSIDIGGN